MDDRQQAWELLLWKVVHDGGVRGDVPLLSAGHDGGCGDDSESSMNV